MKYRNLLIFMMIKSLFSKIIFEEKSIDKTIIIYDLPANFGPDIPKIGLKGNIIISDPINGCTKTSFQDNKSNWFLLIKRGECEFDDKVRTAQNAGAAAAIIYNNHPNENLITMRSKNTQDITIPSVFIDNKSGNIIYNYNNSRTNIAYIYYVDIYFFFYYKLFAIFALSIFVICCILHFVARSRFRNSVAAERISIMTKRQVRKLKKIKFKNKDLEKYQVCAICLDEYIEDDELRLLPCNHEFHAKCIDEWLLKNNVKCPKCRHKANNNLNITLIDHSDANETDDLPLTNNV
tara:strand:- start:852 stop:1730 length:879 start_codon:yes stop_codon:yes gene_type:complete